MDLQLGTRTQRLRKAVSDKDTHQLWMLITAAIEAGYVDYQMWSHVPIGERLLEYRPPAPKPKVLLTPRRDIPSQVAGPPKFTDRRGYASLTDAQRGADSGLFDRSAILDRRGSTSAVSPVDDRWDDADDYDYASDIGFELQGYLDANTGAGFVSTEPGGTCCTSWQKTSVVRRRRSACRVGSRQCGPHTASSTMA